MEKLTYINFDQQLFESYISLEHQTCIYGFVLEVSLRLYITI